MFGKHLESSGGVTENPHLKQDLARLGSVDENALTLAVSRAAEIFPCNVLEVAEVVAQEQGIADRRELFRILSAVMYIWSNTEDAPLDSVASDLEELGFLEPEHAPFLMRLLKVAEGLRETANVVSAYRNIGAPILEDILGTVDLRCRFHTSEADFEISKEPQGIVDIRPVVLATLILQEKGRAARRIQFQMDEHDLRTLRRFVDNMTKELSLAKPLLQQGQKMAVQP